MVGVGGVDYGRDMRFRHPRIGPPNAARLVRPAFAKPIIEHREQALRGLFPFEQEKSDGKGESKQKGQGCQGQKFKAENQDAGLL
jgi:hypothetical protein